MSRCQLRALPPREATDAIRATFTALSSPDHLPKVPLQNATSTVLGMVPTQSSGTHPARQACPWTRLPLGSGTAAAPPSPQPLRASAGQALPSPAPASAVLLPRVATSPPLSVLRFSTLVVGMETWIPDVTVFTGNRGSRTQHHGQNQGRLQLALVGALQELRPSGTATCASPAHRRGGRGSQLGTRGWALTWPFLLAPNCSRGHS